MGRYVIVGIDSEHCTMGASCIARYFNIVIDMDNVPVILAIYFENHLYYSFSHTNTISISSSWFPNKPKYILYSCWSCLQYHIGKTHIDAPVQVRRNSIDIALELFLTYTNPSTWWWSYFLGSLIKNQIQQGFARANISSNGLVSNTQTETLRQ